MKISSQIFTNCMPWYDATSMDISDKLRQCVTPSRPLDSMIDDNQWNIVEPCLLSLPRNRPSMSRLLKSVEGYLVSVGPRNLSGQIKIPQMFANARGGYGDVYEEYGRERLVVKSRSLLPVCICQRPNG